MKRRDFLQRSSLISLAPLLPTVISGAARAAESKVDDRILVVIQLSGGNDELNTLIPFADENYVKHRKVLRIAENSILKLDDSVGLHPSMKAAADLFENGQLSIVQGVGYPNPNRSHFESMDIWQTARMNSEDRTGHGWLGRAADGYGAEQSSDPDSVFVGDSEIPVALRGRRANSISLNSEDELRLFGSFTRPFAASNGGDLDAFIRQTVDASYTAAKRLAESTPAGGDADYPNSRPGKKLQLLSRMLKLDGGTRVFYVSQGGYDTHSDQLNDHSRLLREFSVSLSAFMKDMKESKLDDRVMVLAFSEFGRRVAENGSHGTDHETAGPVFIAGPSANNGLQGTYPSLTDLDEGDLKMTVDFRQVYASILQTWLNVSPAPILNGSFEPISI
ncbi:MAG TPA: DUF1501 domain-containing protein [Fuerstia sp.]|nr:DUF1501 domain-containing protein [Fuerstiella sp.]